MLALAGWGAARLCASPLPPGWLSWGQDWEDLEDTCFPAEQEGQRGGIHQILTLTMEMLLAAHTVAASWASPGRHHGGSTNLWGAGEGPGCGTPTSPAGHGECNGSVCGLGHEDARAGSFPGRPLAPCRIQHSPQGGNLGWRESLVQPPTRPHSLLWDPSPSPAPALGAGTHHKKSAEGCSLPGNSDQVKESGANSGCTCGERQI